MKISKNHKLHETIIEQSNKNNFLLAEKIYKSRGPKFGSGASNYANMITCLNLFYTTKISEKTLSEILTDGHNDDSLDVVYINKNDTIDIFDFKGNKSLGAKDIKALQDSIENNILEEPHDYSTFNEVLGKQLKKVHKKMNNKIRVFIIRNIGAKETAAFESFSAHLKSYSDVVDVVLLTTADIIKQKNGNDSYTDSWDIKIKKDCLFNYNDNNELIIMYYLH